jgi:uncharacterized protein (DUF934 family)
MPLIKNGQYANDTWTRIEGEVPLPDDGDYIIDASRLKDDASVQKPRQGRLGVLLMNTVDAEELAPHLGKLALVALEFPSFNDGRAFSQARVIRHTLGFKGEIRATGKPMADQASHLLRCGFDAFEDSPRQPLEVWQRALAAVPRVYQRDYAAQKDQVRKPG